jgi:hypothetical protein
MGVIVALEGEKAYRTCVEGPDTGSGTVLLAEPVAAAVDRFVADCTGKPSTSCGRASGSPFTDGSIDRRGFA